MNTLFFNFDSFFYLTLLRIITGIFFGSFVALAYVLSDKRKNYAGSFFITVAVLPAVVAVVITLVGSDIAKAVSLGGVFALVRFRSVPGDSRDILFVFFSMAVGLAVGVDLYAVALCLVLLVGAVFVIASRFFKCHGREVKVLKITVPEDLNFTDAFEDIFSRYLLNYDLVSVKTTNMGTLFALSYNVVPAAGLKQKEFLDELRVRNGNLNIIYGEPEELTGPVL